MGGKIFDSFLKCQFEEGMALAQESDLLDLAPSPEDPPDRYMVRFTCRGLVQAEGGEVVEADYFMVGIRFPPDYLRRVEPFEVLTWLGPANVFHPNISDQAPIICVGRLSPGTGLVDLLYQVFEIVTYQRVTMREDDALNPVACAWARRNQDRFPIDHRPLKRRELKLQVEMMTRQDQSTLEV